MKNLSELRVGEVAFVSKISSNSNMRRRLLDMGIVPATKIECVGESPHGDPKAYFIRGAVVAIRSEDASDILVN